MFPAVKGYTTSDVAKLLGLSPAQIRAFARDGRLAPARGRDRSLRFSFQDLVILRTAKGLVSARVPTRRVRAALRRLRRQLPLGRSLAELRVAAEGGRVVVYDGEAAWNPESGQLQLHFAVADLASRAAPFARRTAAAARRAAADYDAEGWYELGIELEAVTPDEARDAYRRALELDVHHADARVNLGRLLHSAGLVDEAERHYRLALRDDPRHATAAYNLAVALEDAGRPADAVEAYRRALQIDRRLADAHHNLARLLEGFGKRAAALRHLGIYRRLVGESR